MFATTVSSSVLLLELAAHNSQLTGLTPRETGHATMPTPEVVAQSSGRECLVQQPVLQINLAGKGLVATIAFLVLLNLMLKQYWTCLMVALAPVPFIVYNDYRNFISLGPGGE